MWLEKMPGFRWLEFLFWVALTPKIASTGWLQEIGFGTQKRLNFTLASLRQQLRCPNTYFSWTATMNNFVDAGKKLMDNSTLCRVFREGSWSVEYNAEFTKQTSKALKEVTDTEILPGRAVEPRDEALLRHVREVSESPGWHFSDGVGIHVARSANSFRLPAPRFLGVTFRTGHLGEYRSKGTLHWRALEESQDLRDLANPQSQLEDRCRCLGKFLSFSFTMVVRQHKIEGMWKPHTCLQTIFHVPQHVGLKLYNLAACDEIGVHVSSHLLAVRPPPFHNNLPAFVCTKWTLDFGSWALKGPKIVWTHCWQGWACSAPMISYEFGHLG